ncbi:protein-export chaperone SecB [Luteolibacter sp. GHJ8]|uniref:Protein-export chaperone SecB n=1 Tax=Luteolibacter rhizosphaerae TaxID=2989719 RepID=A0ABT3G1K0_9BACT|nr:protein-export chaperone SecB [Luteolibacter rhizosphaerae]MCW1913718.1 protein-export chaperone SecB [Luteolibacter rhizosphaerae]
MKLQLKKNVATQMALRAASEEEESHDGYDLAHRTLFTESTNTFEVQFRLTLTIAKSSHAGAQHFEVEYSSFFETDEEFDEEFKNSAFVRVNAPAIAFPFIRSYVAHVTLIAGYEPVILPSVNYRVPDELAKPQV